MARADKECILPIEEGWGGVRGYVEWSVGGAGGDVDDGGRLPASSGVSK